MPPKGIGFACYLLIIVAVLQFGLTLIASQGVNVLFINSQNALSLDIQVLMSTVNSIVLALSATSIINGYKFGRTLLHSWVLIYFAINLWQLNERIYLLPITLAVLVIIFALYAKPSQNFFEEARQKRKNRKVGKRVDASYNIFDDKKPTDASQPDDKNKPSN